MLKKIVLLVILIAFFNVSFAQLVNGNKWGCSFAINSVDAQIGDPLKDTWADATNNYKNTADFTDHSISWSIIPKYFISEDVAVRFEFGITNINMSSYFDSYGSDPQPETEHAITKQSIEQKINRYLPGIQWNFIRTKRIECYVGFSASYLHYSPMHYSLNYSIFGLPKDTINFSLIYNPFFTGGFAIGIGSFAGFNVHLLKHISLGAEFSSSLLYYKIGGLSDVLETVQSFPKPPTQTAYSYSTNAYKGIQFSQILASLNLTIQF